MPTINSSAKINAPVENVLAYVTDPMNLGEWMVGITEVKDVTGSDALSIRTSARLRARRGSTGWV